MRSFGKRLRRIRPGVFSDGKNEYYFGASGVKGTSNEITVTPNPDGTVTVSLPEAPVVGEIKLTPKASSTGLEGTLFYDSDDDHVYVATE